MWPQTSRGCLNHTSSTRPAARLSMVTVYIASAVDRWPVGPRRPMLANFVKYTRPDVLASDCARQWLQGVVQIMMMLA